MFFRLLTLTFDLKFKVRYHDNYNRCHSFLLPRYFMKESVKYRMKKEAEMKFKQTQVVCYHLFPTAYALPLEKQHPVFFSYS
jgi:hypothetical protein